MLDSFSLELVQIRNSFESRLVNSLDGIGDELLSEKKSKLRQIEADMIRLTDRKQKMNKKDYRNAYIMHLRHTIQTHQTVDYQAAMEMLKMVAQLEEIVGDELIQLFKSYMNDLDGDAHSVNKIESGISKAENERNRQSKRALENLNDKHATKKPNNDNFELMVESLKTFVPNSILNEAMEGIRHKENGFVVLNEKEIENNFKKFHLIMRERQQMVQSGRIIDEQLVKQELLYIEQCMEVTSAVKGDNSSTSSHIDQVKLKIAEILFNHKLQSVGKTVDLEKMLKLLVDLKGILFLYLNDYPTESIEQNQLENIYAKTKSEADRIIEKSHMSREASDVSIDGQLKLANRLSELENGENDHRLDLHMVTVDAAQHEVKVQHEKEAMVAKEQKQTQVYQSRLQNQIDHESYTIKRLVSLLGVDFTTMEMVVKQLVEMDQVIMEDLLENLVDGRSRNKMSSKEKQRFFDYCVKYKGMLITAYNVLNNRH